MTLGIWGVRTQCFDLHYWRQSSGIYLNRAKPRKSEKNTRGSMENNQKITVSFKHKGLFFNPIKTGYSIPWEHLRKNVNSTLVGAIQNVY